MIGARLYVYAAAVALLLGLGGLGGCKVQSRIDGARVAAAQRTAARLQIRVDQLGLAVEARDLGLAERDAVIAELQGYIDSTNTVLERLGAEAEAATQARARERARWSEERQRLVAERDAALSAPWPEDCCELLREVARRAP